MTTIELRVLSIMLTVCPNPLTLLCLNSTRLCLSWDRSSKSLICSTCNYETLSFDLSVAIASSALES